MMKIGSAKAEVAWRCLCFSSKKKMCVGSVMRHIWNIFANASYFYLGCLG